MIGALLALATAAMLGFNTAVVRRSMLRASPYTLILVSILGATPVFALLTWFSGQWSQVDAFTGWEYLLLALGGALNFLGGRYANFRAIGAIGANLTAPVRTLSVLFSVMAGLFFLDEEIDAMRWMGIALLVLAPLIAFSQPSAMRTELRSGTALRLAEGILFGLIAAVAYAGAGYLLRLVLIDSNLSMLGATVAHLGAAVVLAASLVFKRNRDGVRGLDSTAQKLFLLITANMVIAQWFRFGAIESAPISVVAPLVESMAFFGLGFAWLINRGHEAFGRMVVLGMVLAVIGAAAVTM